MKSSSKSLLAVKAVASRSSSKSSRTGDRAATPRARTHDDVLVSLVRLIARQTAREWAERRLDSFTATLPLPEKQK